MLIVLLMALDYVIDEWLVYCAVRLTMWISLMKMDWQCYTTESVAAVTKYWSSSFTLAVTSTSPTAMDGLFLM